MKGVYEKPEINVIEFSNEDIIITSGNSDHHHPNGNAYGYNNGNHYGHEKNHGKP